MIIQVININTAEKNKALEHFFDQNVQFYGKYEHLFKK